MPIDPVIAAVAQEFEDFVLAGEEAEEEQAQPTAPAERICKLAHLFRQWKEDLLDKHVRYNADAISLAHAKVLLLDRYFDYRAYAPRVHRDKVGAKGHICLYQIFIDSYHEIRLKQLRLSAAPLFQPVQLPPPPLIPEIFVNEKTE